MTYLIGTAILFVAVGSLSGGISKNPPIELGIGSYQFLVLGTAGCAAWLLTRFRLQLPALGFRFPGWQTLVRSALVVPLASLGITVLYLLFNTFLPGYHLQGNSQELVQGGSTHIGLASKALVFVWAAIEAPIAEETLFRGIVYQGLRTYFSRRLPYGWAVFAGAMISGLAFGLAHFQIHTLPILVFLGVVLAYVFQLTRSLYASALVHGIFNAIAVVALFSSS